MSGGHSLVPRPPAFFMFFSLYVQYNTQKWKSDEKQGSCENSCQVIWMVGGMWVASDQLEVAMHAINSKFLARQVFSILSTSWVNHSGKVEYVIWMCTLPPTSTLPPPDIIHVISVTNFPFFHCSSASMCMDAIWRTKQEGPGMWLRWTQGRVNFPTANKMH